MAQVGEYPQTQAPTGEMYVVYGIPISDENTAKLTRKVMNISLGMIAFSMVTWIVSIVAMTTKTDDKDDEEDDSSGTSGRTFSVSIIAALCIPLCGYYGAKNHNPNLLNAFWVCNLLCVIDFIITLVVVITLLRQGDLTGLGTGLWATFIVFGIMAATLQCAGFIYGRQLAAEEYWTAITPGNIPTAPPVQTSAHYTQPPQQPTYSQPHEVPVGHPSNYPRRGTAPEFQYDNPREGYMV